MRGLWILLLCLILAGLLVYAYFVNPIVTLPMILDNPEEYDGKVVRLGTEATVYERLPDGFVLSQMGRKIRALGNPENADAGDFVQIKAVFHKEGHLDLMRIYVAKRRRLKVIVSIWPALLVLFLVIKTYAFDKKGFYFKERA